MEVKEIRFDTVSKETYGGKNIIYGAGYNGKLLLEKLHERKVSVEAFYDDDKSRWGEDFCGKRILSQSQFAEYDKKLTNIFVSSMYIGQITAKIKEMGFQKVYASLDLLLEKDSEDFKFNKYTGNQDYIRDLEYLLDVSQDSLTKKYFGLIRETVLKGRAIPEIVDLYCGEKQYFLSCFKGKLDGLNFLDGGAYTGDTVREMCEEGIYPGMVYCFEADDRNYRKLVEYRNSSKNKEYIVCENSALWDCRTKLGMKFENYNARIDTGAKETTVETVTIDEYFSNIKTGFIKMDIEGAERRALAGGMKTIKRDRPILAVSIYHGLEDMVGIPKILMNELERYSFVVRHHSYTYSETVLYCVPKELGIL